MTTEAETGVMGHKPRNASSQQKLEEARSGSSRRASGGQWGPADTPGFRHNNADILYSWRQQVSAVLSHPICGNLLQESWEINTRNGKMAA